MDMGKNYRRSVSLHLTSSYNSTEDFVSEIYTPVLYITLLKKQCILSVSYYKNTILIGQKIILYYFKHF